MANQKRVFTASDAAPVVLYAKEDAAVEEAFPLDAFEFGYWDSILPSYGTLVTTYLFYKDFVLKKTITLTYSDATKSTLTLVTKT